MNIQTIIDMLNLEPLPVEGGFFRQAYHSSDSIPTSCLPQRYPSGEKPFCTVIYYLLTDHPDSFSALHKLPTDEIYHFYLGDPLEMTLLNPDGSTRTIILGQDLLAGQQVQFVVPKDTWQGSCMLPGGKFALLGASMSPGWTDADYTHGQRDLLLQQYPQQKDAILKLTREG